MVARYSSRVKRSTEALVASDLFEVGIGHVVVSRFKNDGRAEIGAFLVDVYCLGVKDAFFTRLDSTEEYDRISGRFFPSPPAAMTPEAARKLIESAVAYAAKSGFHPARDYKKACRVFGGIDASRCTESFTFGKDGKPCYVASPSESGAQQERIQRMLEAQCGPGNFGFFRQFGEGEIEDLPHVLTEEDRERFRDDLSRSTGREVTLSKDGPKISDRLLNVARPYLDEGADPEEMKALALATMVAWNLAGTYRGDLTKKLQELHDATPQELRSTVDLMVARKKKLYPNDNRLVLEAEIVKSPAGVLTFIAAALRGNDETVD